MLALVSYWEGAILRFPLNQYMIMALDRAIRHERSRSVYEERGLLPL
jgi:hypothetical protein